MAKTNSNTESGSESGSESPSKFSSEKKSELISLSTFCDISGVNEVDRNAVYMKFGKRTEKSESDWIKALGSKISLRKTDK